MLRKIVLILCVAFVVVCYGYPCFILPFGEYVRTTEIGNITTESTYNFDWDGTVTKEDELGITTIFVTHDQEEAMRMSDRIYLMHEGQIEQEGSPMDLYLNPETPFAAGFMGHYNLYEESTGFWAIRPEAIEMSDSEWIEERKEYCALEGHVKRIIPQGNIMRYTVDTGKVNMDVDVLYEAGVDYRQGEKVYLRYQKNQVKRWRK